MKAITIFLSLIWLYSFEVPAQTVSIRKAVTSFSQRNGSKPKLQLTTSVIEQWSCSSDNLTFRLRFTLRNVGSVPVIIEKKLVIASIMVSRDVKAATSEKYEQKLTSDMYGPPSDFFDPPTDLSKFLVLQPGEAHEFKDRASVGVYDGRPHSKLLLRPGSYFLQIGFGTWSYIGDPKPFRRRWREQGYLWSDGLTSEPMPFTVAEKLEVIKCT